MPRKREMTVGELRRALEGVGDAMPVVADYFEERDEGDVEGIGGLASVSVEYRCAETPSFFLLILHDVGGERKGPEDV